MNENLRRKYRQLGETVPPYGHVDRAIADARRRRVVRRVGMPAVAVAAVGGLIAGSASWWTDFTQPRPSTPASQQSSPASQQSSPASQQHTLADWAPDRFRDGAPAEAGTLLYHSCAGGTCGIRLVDPAGNEFPLSDVRPDLAAAIRDSGVDGMTVSYDATWLGLSTDDGGYTFHSLPSAREHGGPTEIQVPPGPPGSHWEIVEWGWTSAGVSLARWSRGTVTAVASVDTLGTSDQGLVETVQVPLGLDLAPVADGATSVVMAEPVDTDVPPAERPRVTQATTRTLFVRGDDGGYSKGELLPPTRGPDVSECLRPGETLAGPEGVPVFRDAPPSPILKSGPESVGGALVFAPHNDGLVPSAMLRGRRCEGPGWMGLGRLDIPVSTAGTDSAFLGFLSDGEVAIARSSVEAVDVVAIGFNGEWLLQQGLPADARVLLPGAVMP